MKKILNLLMLGAFLGTGVSFGSSEVMYTASFLEKSRGTKQGLVYPEIQRFKEKVQDVNQSFLDGRSKTYRIDQEIIDWAKLNTLEKIAISNKKTITKHTKKGTYTKILKYIKLSKFFLMLRHCEYPELVIDDEISSLLINYKKMAQDLLATVVNQHSTEFTYPAGVENPNEVLDIEDDNDESDEED